MGSVKALRPTPGLGVGPKSAVCPGLLADWNPRTLDRAPAQTYVQSAARAGGRRWATTGGTGTRSGDGSTRRPRTDPVLVMLLVAITTELLAGLGFALGIQPAGSLGMITASLLTVMALALVLRRQLNRPAARRIYVGLLGCVGVACARPTRRCWPPESCEVRRPASATRSTRSSAVPAASHAARRPRPLSQPA